ncbi:MAG: selenocysteine-specific translation elongation factor [Lachnospiraceae bacterium]
MEHLIIGTAGHIDHGKTALIKALTGRDTDTLKEEKMRGISIDLGFTYFDLPDGNRAGIIDVPGHEKFLPNMLAGVCGMDLVLLTIALDEGIMPQTREHMDILEQLHVKNGILVLTKMDMVETDWADAMEQEIREQVKGTIFEHWPLQRVSAIKNLGMDELKEKIVEQANTYKRERSVSGRFRMPIDRVMSIKGIGTVVAGTILEGAIHVEDEIMLYPSLIRAKVRSIQMHGETVSAAYAGQRTALNLASIKKEEVHRGFVAAYPESMKNSSRIDVRLEMIRGTSRVITNQMRLHLHIGTAEVLCRVILLQHQELKAGESGYAQLVLEKEIAVKKMDYFVLRFYSPLETIGGGVVLNEYAPKHKRKENRVVESLKQREENRNNDVLLSIIEEFRHRPIGEQELIQRANLIKETVSACLEELKSEEACISLRGKKGGMYWSFTAEEEVQRRVCSELKRYHQKYRYRLGMTKLELKNALFATWEQEWLDGYLYYLIEQEQIKKEGEYYSLYKFAVEETEELQQLETTLWAACQEAGYSFKRYRELKQKQMDSEYFEDMINYLITTERFVRISDDFCTTPELVEEIIEKVKKFLESNERISFASLRDLLGTTRRSSKPLMAFLDEQKVTRWCGKETERQRY